MELFFHYLHLCHTPFSHVQGSKGREIRNDETPAPFADLALYSEFFNVRAYDDSTTECLFLRAPTDRLEDEIETTNGRREGLQGGRRPNPA